MNASGFQAESSRSVWSRPFVTPGLEGSRVVVFAPRPGFRPFGSRRVNPRVHVDSEAGAFIFSAVIHR
jgi:hypothetical protein